jgi:SPP1 family predicted phage head-tail adaptor
MYTPHPGKLRYMIEIGKTFSVTNENGYPEESDSVLYRVWAGIEDDSSRWFNAAGTDNAERGLCFVIRRLAEIRPGMWIRWNGEKQLITKIGEYDFKRRYMKLTTIAVEGVK